MRRLELQRRYEEGQKLAAQAAAAEEEAAAAAAAAERRERAMAMRATALAALAMYLTGFARDLSTVVVAALI